MMEDRVEEARQCINRAAQLRSDKSLWKYRGLGLCPTVFPNTEAIKGYRENLEQQLNAVLKEKPKFDWRTVAEDGFRPSFQLAHHGLCNRRIMEKFATIFSGAFPPRRCKKAPHHRVRVGFVAMQHQIGNFLLWYGPLLSQLDRRKIEPFVLCPRQAVPQCKKVINSEGIQWLDLSASMLKCIKQIEQAELDVLCYFQVGTDNLSYFLPFVRLAPIQCTSWGTLGTMGIPTIDCYISSSLTERVGAQDDYSEKLCLFDGVPSHQVRDPSRMLTEQQKGAVRKEHGLPKTGAIYLCPQKLVKFHPEFDLFLRGVLETDRDGTIILFRSSCSLGFEKLFKRFSKTIGEPLLRRLRVIPFQELNAYRRVVAASDVILDSPHYSSSITGIDAFAAATPIVTLPGQLLVERFALGMYRQIGISDLIAKDIADYVNLAVTLGTNIRYRRVISERIQDESKTLFDNQAVVREYESYFRGLQNGL